MQQGGKSGTSGTIKDVAKVVVIGDTNVGKTSMVNTLVNGDFKDTTTATIGADFHNFLISLTGSKDKINL